MRGWKELIRPHFFGFLYGPASEFGEKSRLRWATAVLDMMVIMLMGRTVYHAFVLPHAWLAMFNHVKMPFPSLARHRLLFMVAYGPCALMLPMYPYDVSPI